MSCGKLQLTLAIIKPDVTRTPHAYKVIKWFLERNNFLIIRQKVLRLSRENVEKFYEEHKTKFFYRRLTSFMSSGPIEALILGHEDAIKNWRALMGPTKVLRAHLEAPQTIRGMIGLTDTRNSTHGSDSEEAAAKEISFFFPDFSFHKWVQEGKPVVKLNRKGEWENL